MDAANPSAIAYCRWIATQPGRALIVGREDPHLARRKSLHGRRRGLLKSFRLVPASDGPRREFKIALGFALGYGSAKRICDLEEVVRFRT
jgi:hypothetical protein